MVVTSTPVGGPHVDGPVRGIFIAVRKTGCAMKVGLAPVDLFAVEVRAIGCRITCFALHGPRRPAKIKRYAWEPGMPRNAGRRLEFDINILGLTVGGCRQERGINPRCQAKPLPTLLDFHFNLAHRFSEFFQNSQRPFALSPRNRVFYL